MANSRWLSNAAKEKHVATLVVTGTWLATETITLTIGTVTVTITIGSLVTTAQVAESVKQAFEGETLTDTTGSVSPTTGINNIGQFSKITATRSSSTVTFTADDGGKPFTMSANETSASGGVTFSANATPATGPFHADKADNFSLDAVLANNDHFILDTGSGDILHGLTTGVQLTKLTKFKSYTGNIGLPSRNADNSSLPFSEYRTPLALTFANNAVTCTYELEVGEGQGSNRIRIDAGAGDSIFNVYGAGQRIDTALPTTLLTGTHASTVLNNYNGDVGFAFYPDDTGTLAALRNGNGDTTSAKTYCGIGCTLTGCTIEVNGGTLTTNSAISTSSGGITIFSGDHYHHAGTVGNLTIQGGSFHLRAAANISFTGTVKVYGQGEFDLSEYQHEASFTNDVELYDEAHFNDPNSTAAANTDFLKVGEKVKLTLGANRILRKTA